MMLQYWTCLQENKYYRLLWIAEVIDNVGSWLNYVATLELVDSFSGGSGLAISVVVLVRFFPSLLLSPIAGVVADRCNRINIIVVCALLDAVFVACLLLIHNPSQVWLLYGLLTAQFAGVAMQDPAKKAMIPVLVPRDQLHLASTLDTFAWSLTGAVGAGVGGIAASKFGNAACFILDSATYLLAAWCAWQIPKTLGHPDAIEHNQHAAKVHSTAPLDEEVEEVELSRMTHTVTNGLDQGALKKLRSGIDHHAVEDLENAPLLAGSTSNINASLGGSEAAATLVHLHHHGGNSTRRSIDNSKQLEAGENQQNSSTLLHSTITPPISPPAAASSSIVQMATAAILEGVRATQEGWRYVIHPGNRDVAALVLMKGSGSLTWGAIDVLNVKFSEMDVMQGAHLDGPTTLGLIFAFVGLGCFLGPLMLNPLVPPKPRPLMWACCMSFAFLAIGMALMVVSPNIYMLLLSTFIRAIGSACLWIYTTLLLQLRVPNSILGRISALEMALYTVAEAVSSIFGGAAFDVLQLSLRETVLSLTVLSTGVAAAWFLFTWQVQRDAT